MTTKKRIIAAALALILLLIIALSVCVTVLEAAHNCSGVDCHICRLLRDTADVLRAASAVLLLIFLHVLVLCTRSHPRITAAFPLYRSTPVSDKVRLLN